MENLFMKIPHEISVQTWQLAALIGFVFFFAALIEIIDFKRKKLKKELADTEKERIAITEVLGRYMKSDLNNNEQINQLLISIDAAENKCKILEGQIRHFQKQLTRYTDINRKFAVNRAMELVKVSDIPATPKFFEVTYKMIYRFVAGKERINEDNNEK